MPISKYEKKLFSWTPCIVGIDNIAYTNIGTCGTFTDFMAEDIASKENRELSEAYFFSVLWDGTTDKSVLEQGVTFVL